MNSKLLEKFLTHIDKFCCFFFSNLFFFRLFIFTVYEMKIIYYECCRIGDILRWQIEIS